MAIKVQFEIGHSATVKSKRTPDGFTHDWELYVQGVNKADISAFVDKVVFNLHDSFPKPKRSFKEPPYVLKESGYAGFVLPIDIYFRNRDEPKRVTYSYDLDLQQEGPPVHRSEVKKHIFENPSEDFRQKLLKGGGIAVSGVVGGAIGTDEKSLDMSLADGRNQMVGKPKLSSDASGASSSSKKHKQRTDDAKTNTFTDLFGTPITKSAPKFSPDPKTKTANGGAGVPMAGALVGNSKSGGGKDKSNSAGAVAGTASTGSVGSGGKEKEKADKKDKHKQSSPHKEKLHEEKESKKKSDGKHDKKEEKKKDKKDKDKDRERNKEKASKRALSPKSATVAAPSPKRPSPVRSSSAASRDDPSVKTSRSSESDKRASGSSSGKKSKKEKKSHDKDRDHKDKHRTESKEPVTATNTVSPVTVAPQPAPTPTQPPPPPTAASKAPNASVASKPDLNSNKSQKASEKESKKIDSVSKSTDKDVSPLITDKKNSAEKDKKSHKHKKKDKNKEKEKEKDKDQGSKKSAASKEKKDKKEKTAKNEATASTSTAAAGGSKKSSTSAEAMVDIANDSGSTKSSTSSSSSKTSKPSNTASASSVPTPSNANNTGSTLTSGLLNNLADNVYGNIAENLHTSSSNSNSEKAAAIQSSDSSNSSFPDLPATQPQTTQKVTTLFQTPANPQPTPPPTIATTPSSTPAAVSSNSATIQETSRSAQAADKRDHKAHRGADKSKTEKAAEKEDKKRRRNSTAVNTFVEPPLKQIKKDLNAKTAREKSQSPLLRAEDKQTFLPPPATTSSLAVQNTPVTALNLEYLSELQELHQKIMTLQDNEELQQVVEMIAATGRYEITSKTFDFDLCKLDRHTVQRLQDFFATSVS